MNRDALALLLALLAGIALIAIYAALAGPAR